MFSIVIDGLCLSSDIFYLIRFCYTFVQVPYQAIKWKGTLNYHLTTLAQSTALRLARQMAIQPRSSQYKGQQKTSQISVILRSRPMQICKIFYFLYSPYILAFLLLKEPSMLGCISLYQLLMNRNNQASGQNSHKQAHEHQPTQAVLVYAHSSNSPKNSINPFKNKFDQFGFKQSAFGRHQSEKELKRNEKIRLAQYLPPPEQPRTEEENFHKHPNAYLDRAKPNEPQPKRVSNGKPSEKQGEYYPNRGSGGRANNNNLKETSSTATTDCIGTYKSEKTFPSFLRNQTKSPSKFKCKEGLSKSDFKIIRRLGEGKFGTAYLARELHSGMMVCLKVVQKKRILRDNFLGQFIRELKIQSFMEHPNIINIYGYFQEGEQFYIVMELGCDGQLFDILANGQTLSEETTSFIVGNLLDAIQQLHALKILHRDIKPENIVLVHGNIKLCDFGWAVNKKEQLRSTFCGTPLYLSPELLQGARYDEKVDLWAIGILAFELYFGTSPFDINEQADLIKIVTDEIQFPTNRKISVQFKQFLTAILRKNPQQRMSCNELMVLQFIRKYRELQTCEELCH